MTGALYALRVAGPTPVTAELVADIGETEVLHVRLGALVLVVSPELADDLADAIIECVAARADPVAYVPAWRPT